MLVELLFKGLIAVSAPKPRSPVAVSDTDKVGFHATFVYGFEEDNSQVVMESTTVSPTVSIPAYFVNYTSGAALISFNHNMSRSPLLALLAQTTASSQPLARDLSGGHGVGNKNKNNDDDGTDSFGEHYFHICIYIWACVVVSSLIALSVKWGCCGRSLTRWEVKKIPLKRFQRTEGDDYNQDKCPICHEEFNEGRLIRQLPCNHCYHSYCVDKWLVKMSNRCPLCKQRVSMNLFCPWSKQRRKKQFQRHLSSDAEASVDESPPLPPLCTLTPSNWYGEAIMSAPSKFIIMRPGKPTRVIDLREQSVEQKTSNNGDSDVGEEILENCDKTIDTGHWKSFLDSGPAHSGETQPSCTSVHSSRSGEVGEEATSDNSYTVSAGMTDVRFSVDNVNSSQEFSRSCSISSDHPLLLDSCGDLEERACSMSDPFICRDDAAESMRDMEGLEQREDGSYASIVVGLDSWNSIDVHQSPCVSEVTVDISSASSSVVSHGFVNGSSVSSPHTSVGSIRTLPQVVDAGVGVMCSKGAAEVRGVEVTSCLPHGEGRSLDTLQGSSVRTSTASVDLGSLSTSHHSPD